MLVTGQFGSLAALLLTTQAWRSTAPVWLLMGLSLVTGMAAILAMRSSKLRISPVPAKQATLVTTGIYRLIRHPMYTAVLLFAAAMLLADFNWWRLFLLIFLFVVLLVKLKWEEQLLLEKFTGYRQYIAGNKMLLPFLF